MIICRPPPRGWAMAGASANAATRSSAILLTVQSVTPVHGGSTLGPEGTAPPEIVASPQIVAKPQNSADSWHSLVIIDSHLMPPDVRF